MSYQFPQQQAPRRKGGGGMFFLIFLGVGAFLLFSRLGNGPPVDGPAIDNGPGQQQGPTGRWSVKPIENDFAREREPVLETDKPRSKIGQAMPSTGGTGAAAGWNMDDVVTKENSTAPAKESLKRPMPSATQNSDWAIEDVEGKKPAANRQLQFSNPTNTPISNPQSDWSIENVEPKSRTQNGDWSIEETN